MSLKPAIFNASTLTLDRVAGPTPNMRSTLNGWVRPLGLTKVTTTVVDHEAVPEERDLPGLGIWQPLTPNRLAIKPEGERSWSWFMILCTTDLKLRTDDVIKRDGIPYRVMADAGWDDDGFRCYEIVNDYNAQGRQP